MCNSVMPCLNTWKCWVTKNAYILFWRKINCIKKESQSGNRAWDSLNSQYAAWPSYSILPGLSFCRLCQQPFIWIHDLASSQSKAETSWKSGWNWARIWKCFPKQIVFWILWLCNNKPNSTLHWRLGRMGQDTMNKPIQRDWNGLPLFFLSILLTLGISFAPRKLSLMLILGVNTIFWTDKKNLFL